MLIASDDRDTAGPGRGPARDRAKAYQIGLASLAVGVVVAVVAVLLPL